MPGWFVPKTRRISFEELGYAQFWIEVKEMGSLLFDETLIFEGLEESSSEEVMAALAMVIYDWNLTDPETGKKLAVPTRKAPESLHRLPTSFLQLIQKKFEQSAEDLAGPEGVLKKAKEMPLEAISEESKE